MLVYSSGDLNLLGYTNSDFQADKDSRKSKFGSIIPLVVEGQSGEALSNPALLTQSCRLST